MVAAYLFNIIYLIFFNYISSWSPQRSLPNLLLVVLLVLGFNVITIGRKNKLWLLSVTVFSGDYNFMQLQQNIYDSILQY